VALGVIAVLVGLRGDRAALPDRSEHVLQSVPLPPFDAVRTQTQPLVGREDGLSGVHGALATYGGGGDCALDLSLTDDRGRVVASRRVPCSDLRDNVPAPLLTFAPEQHSAGRTYSLHATLAPGASTGTVAFWGGPVPSGLKAAVVAGSDLGLTAAVFTVYGEPVSFLQRLPTILRRLALLAPWWGQPAFSGSGSWSSAPRSSASCSLPAEPWPSCCSWP